MSAAGVVQQAIEGLLVAGAHEVLARSSWSALFDPAHAEKVAAAAGVLAYARVRDERARCFGIVLGAGAMPIALGKFLGVLGRSPG